MIKVLLLALLFGLNLPAALPTLPPPPGEAPHREDLRSAEAALFAGRPERAYRILLSRAAFGKEDPAVLSLLVRTLLALDRPLDAARVLGRMEDTPAVRSRIRALLQRNLTLDGKVVLSQVPFPMPGLDPRILKGARAIAPAPDGGAFLMSRDTLLTLGADGKTLAVRSLPGALDLSLDEAGKPLALGEGLLLWGDRVVNLPPTFGSPSSVAALSEGTAVLLDTVRRRLIKVDGNGNAVGSAEILLSDPYLVRADGAGRLYVADGRGGRIFVLGGDLTVLKVLDPKAAGVPLKRLSDFQVDFAGNLLLLDGRAHRLILLSSTGKLLFLSGEGGPRISAAGWDGLDRILFVDGKVPRAGGLQP